MGKPSGSMRPSDDAVSLHTQTDRFEDDDTLDLSSLDDLPPQYEETASGSSAPLLPPSIEGQAMVADYGPYEFSQSDAQTGAEYLMDPRFRDAGFLEKQIELWSKLPPRPFVRVHGTHSETVDNKGKKEQKTVTDFDVSIELTPYLFNQGVPWRSIETVENGDNVRRGTILRKRAPGLNRSIELGADTKPTITEWCHRFCARHTGLKVFDVRRRMTGFNEEILQGRILQMVRSTNYRGRVHVTFPVRNASVQVYNDCRVNRWRLIPWLFWVCVFTLTFIFTWPYLFFRTKRFEVVTIDYAFQRVAQDGSRSYATISEWQLWDLWKEALNQAVVSKRQGTLDQQDLRAASAEIPTYGHAVVDGAVGLMRASIAAMNEANRQLGWGHDT